MFTKAQAQELVSYSLEGKPGLPAEGVSAQWAQYGSVGSSERLLVRFCQNDPASKSFESSCQTLGVYGA